MDGFVAGNFLIYIIILLVKQVGEKRPLAIRHFRPNSSWNSEMLSLCGVMAKGNDAQ